MLNTSHGNQNTCTGYKWPVGLWFTIFALKDLKLGKQKVGSMKSRFH